MYQKVIQTSVGTYIRVNKQGIIFVQELIIFRNELVNIIVFKYCLVVYTILYVLLRIRIDFVGNVA